jgi:rRNA processing protein Krr1/Pno1
MGSEASLVEMGDEGFTLQIAERTTEVLVRVDRHVLGVIGDVSPDEVRPAVQRLQAYASGP